MSFESISAYQKARIINKLTDIIDEYVFDDLTDKVMALVAEIVGKPTVEADDDELAPPESLWPTYFELREGVNSGKISAIQAYCDRTGCNPSYSKDAIEKGFATLGLEFGSPY